MTRGEEAGFALLDVVVAMSLILIVLVTGLGLTQATLAAGRASREELRGQQLAQGVMEALRFQQQAPSGTETLGEQTYLTACGVSGLWGGKCPSSGSATFPDMAGLNQGFMQDPSWPTSWPPPSPQHVTLGNETYTVSWTVNQASSNCNGADDVTVTVTWPNQVGKASSFSVESCVVPYR